MIFFMNLQPHQSEPKGDGMVKKFLRIAVILEKIAVGVEEIAVERGRNERRL